MKEKIEKDSMKIGLSILAALAIVALAFAFTQNPSTSTEVSPNQNSEMILPETSNKTTVYFFWGDGCPYCAKEKPFLEELDEKHEDLEVKMYEVYYNKTNQQIYQNVAQKYDTQPRGIPATFIGKKHWAGYNQQIGNQIEAKVEECLKNSCESPLE